MDFLKDRDLIISMVNDVKDIDKKIDSYNNGEEYIELLKEHLSKITELNNLLSYYQHTDYSTKSAYSYFIDNEGKLKLIKDLEMEKVSLLDSFECKLKEFKDKLSNPNAIKELLSLYKTRDDLLENINKLTQEYSRTFPINNIAELYGEYYGGKWKMTSDVQTRGCTVCQKVPTDPYWDDPLPYPYYLRIKTYKTVAAYLLRLECTSTYNNGLYYDSLTVGQWTPSFAYVYRSDCSISYAKEEAQKMLQKYEKLNFTDLYFHKLTRDIDIEEENIEYTGLFDEMIEDYLTKKSKCLDELKDENLTSL